MTTGQDLWLLSGLNDRNPWWNALLKLDRSLTEEHADSAGAYRQLWRALVAAGDESVPAALAFELLYGLLPLPVRRLERESLRRALELDLVTVNRLAGTDWHGLVTERAGRELPVLSGLAESDDGALQGIAGQLALGRLTSGELLEVWRRQGQGQLAHGKAWRWQGGELELISGPVSTPLSTLHGLDGQIGRLRAAVEAWLEGGPGLNILLYGPRGSGKSTAARALLSEYGHRGLRMIELAASELTRLPELLRRLEESPLKFMLFTDDLGFSRDDGVWQQLKTVLDGTLQALPRNVQVLATSNRRTLVAQKFSDRPDPLDDDVSAWDTAEEKLALADRFGAVITFPSADQRHYLQVVTALAAERGLAPEGLQEAALLFARRGNGPSGRTARQFIDSIG